MTRTNALRMMLEIVEECKTHGNENGGCRDCAFGCGSDCLVANGSDIPSDWLINEKVCEWTQRK